MNENNDVAIIMSTYNGEKWLKEQLDSLINQTYKNIKIYIRDDGSKDNTLNILKEYEKKESNITVFSGENLGYVKSFFEILKNVTDCKYYSFCDQDDIWHEDKVERAVKMLDKEENNKALMYFSDYDFYDGDMNFTGHFTGNKKGPSFRNSLVDVISLGNCIVINDIVRQKMVLSGPEYVFAHDWWAYCIASGMGKVIYDKTPTIKYRRHGNNTSNVGMSFISLQIFRIKKFILGDYFKVIKKQQLKYNKYFYNDLPEENQKIMKLFTNEKYNFKNALIKTFYPKMFRQKIIDEILIRIMFLFGRI